MFTSPIRKFAVGAGLTVGIVITTATAAFAWHAVPNAPAAICEIKTDSKQLTVDLTSSEAGKPDTDGRLRIEDVKFSSTPITSAVKQSADFSNIVTVTASYPGSAEGTVTMTYKSYFPNGESKDETFSWSLPAGPCVQPTTTTAAPAPTTTVKAPVVTTTTPKVEILTPTVEAFTPHTGEAKAQAPVGLIMACSIIVVLALACAIYLARKPRKSC